MADSRHDPTSFVWRLRAEGLNIAVDRLLSFTAALGVLASSRSELDPVDVYWAGRSTLLRNPEERPVYDRAFAEEFLGGATLPPQAPRGTVVDVGYDPAGGSVERDGAAVEAADVDLDAEIRWSRAEVLGHRDFAEATPEELRELWAAVGRLRIDVPAARGGRLRPAASGPLDLRRSVRAALARDGEVLELDRRARGPRSRRVVLLVDVSGSMEPYARALVRFAHAVSRGRRRVEVFAVGTRLTRLTRQLDTRDPDLALGAAAAEVVDWSGGTRLGHGLGRFLDEWGQRGMARGATVVVLSDGWDRGDPGDMTAQMARLARLAHRIVWVNPLRATPGYAPLARGMAAALPYCDDFVDGHSLSSLLELADLLSGDGERAHRRAPCPAGSGVGR